MFRLLLGEHQVYHLCLGAELFNMDPYLFQIWPYDMWYLLSNKTSGYLLFSLSYIGITYNYIILMWIN
jgi:hypothetical protein